MYACQRHECQTTAGCAHRGPMGQLCYFPTTPDYAPYSPPVGCICPPTAEQTCKNPMCPRVGALPTRIT